VSVEGVEKLRTLDGLLAYLRGLAAPCAPPVGVGAFVVLYASAREVVVWYAPAREEHREGEVSIPCRRVAAAWEALVAGETLDEAALEAIGEGPAGGRWLLALLAQAPGVRVRMDSNPPAPTLTWSVEEAERRLRPAKEMRTALQVSQKTRRAAKQRGQRRVKAPATALLEVAVEITTDVNPG
jgi:hypothetical protein